MGKVEQMEVLALEFGCRVDLLLFIYLGKATKSIFQI